MGAVATACAAWFAAYTAYRGLQKWRDETLGKRNTELAEQVLASFYEARDVFTWVRAPVRSLGEGASRSAGGPESDDLKQKRDSYFTPIERLRQEKELFAKLHAQRYMFAAYFGEADA